MAVAISVQRQLHVSEPKPKNVVFFRRQGNFMTIHVKPRSSEEKQLDEAAKNWGWLAAMLWLVVYNALEMAAWKVGHGESVYARIYAMLCHMSHAHVTMLLSNVSNVRYIICRRERPPAGAQQNEPAANQPETKNVFTRRSLWCRERSWGGGWYHERGRKSCAVQSDGNDLFKKVTQSE